MRPALQLAASPGIRDSPAMNNTYPAEPWGAEMTASWGSDQMSLSVDGAKAHRLPSSTSFETLRNPSRTGTGYDARCFPVRRPTTCRWPPFRLMSYTACEVVSGTAHVTDTEELAELAWVPHGEIPEYLPYGLFGPVQEYLNAALAS